MNRNLVGIGMVLLGQLEIVLLDLRLGGILGNAENLEMSEKSKEYFVVIALGVGNRGMEGTHVPGRHLFVTHERKANYEGARGVGLKRNTERSTHRMNIASAHSKGSNTPSHCCSTSTAKSIHKFKNNELSKSSRNVELVLLP